MSFLALQRTPPGFDPGGVATAFVGVPPAATPRRRSRRSSSRTWSSGCARCRWSRPRRWRSGCRCRDSIRDRPTASGTADPAAAPAPARQPRDGQRGLFRADAHPVRYRPRVHRRRSRGRAGRLHHQSDVAKRLFPGEIALGKVMLRGRDATLKAEVVGVIHDVKTSG